MSRAANEFLPIGPVQVYWNNVRLGSPKSQAMVRYNKETVQYGYEDSTVNIGSYKFKETCEVDVTIADLVNKQLRYVYDQSTSYTSRTAPNSTTYVSASTTVFRFREEQKLTGTTAVVVDQAGFDTSTVTLMKSDYTTEYTKNTDYKLSGTNAIKRFSAGCSITDGETVIVMYNQSATASVVLAGGNFFDIEAPLRLVHILDSGKTLQFYAPRAKRIGASDVAINMTEAFPGYAMTFHLLGDMTKPQGKQLFMWSKES